MLFEKGEKVGGYIIICLVREFNGIVINKLKIMNFLFLSKFFYLLKMGLFLSQKFHALNLKLIIIKIKVHTYMSSIFLSLLK